MRIYIQLANGCCRGELADLLSGTHYQTARPHPPQPPPHFSPLAWSYSLALGVRNQKSLDKRPVRGFPQSLHIPVKRV